MCHVITDTTCLVPSVTRSVFKHLLGVALVMFSSGGYVLHLYLTAAADVTISLESLIVSYEIHVASPVLPPTLNLPCWPSGPGC